MIFETRGTGSVSNIPTTHTNAKLQETLIIYEKPRAYLCPDCIDKRRNLFEVGDSSFYPEKISSVLKTGDAVQNNSVTVGVVTELVESIGHPDSLAELAILVDQCLSFLEISDGVDRDSLQEAVVLIWQVSRSLGHWDLLSETSSKRISPGHDHSLLHTKLQEGVPDRVDLGQEVFMRHSHLASLVATLLGVRHLVLHLNAAGSSQDHLLGKLIGRLLVTKPCINVSHDRNNVSLEVVDEINDSCLLLLVSILSCLVQVSEQFVELPGVSLAEEGVDLLDQVGNSGLLVHGLVRQGSELAPHGCDHPAGEVEITFVSCSKVLLDGDHLLLSNEPVPASQRLGEQSEIRGFINDDNYLRTIDLLVVAVILLHVLPHDLGGVLGHVQASLELILKLHSRDVLRLQVVPALPGPENARGIVHHLLIVSHRDQLV